MRAGADVALAWKLPRDIVDVCTHHHSAGDVSIVAVRIVKAAEALIKSLSQAPFNPFQPMANVRPEDLELLSRVGIKAERVPALLTDVERQVTAHRDVGMGT
jgi:hypothetical protein